jgi:hypothetical protein
VNSGSGPDASAHDDYIVSLGLALAALESCGVRVGERRLPAHGCPHGSTSCVLMGGNGLPYGGPVCDACPGWRVLREAWQAEGAGQDLRTFAGRFVNPNAIDRQFQAWANAIL